MKQAERIDLGICLALVASTLAVYAQVVGFEFVNADDHTYVTGNLTVKRGLAPSSILWALTTGEASNWHPLTWLSHMLDIQLYGLWAGGHHLTNLIFHVLNSLLLFWVLRSATGARWPSAFVAALFALHPLHVESVAWVSERKDVLSTCFGLLSMRAYVEAVRRGRDRLGLATLFLALGLLAKPMLVTLPFVFLLLDYWPLGRLRVAGLPVVEGDRPARPLRSLLAEKLPLFAFSLASCVMTYSVQQAGGAVKPAAVVSIPLRLANAGVSYLRYIGKMLWPNELGILYPHPYVAGTGGQPWEAWQIAGALTVLALLSWLFLKIARRPYTIVGWLWYLGTLVPVIGLVQVGNQAMADRYTYLPLIGLFIIIAWGGAELVAAQRARRAWLPVAAGAGAAAVLLACAILSSLQAALWRDSIRLFEHALEVAPRNSIIHVALGTSFAERRRHEEAAQHSRKALEIKPDYVEAYWNLGNALQAQGRRKEAIEIYEQALVIEPDNAITQYNLGNALSRDGQLEASIAPYERAISASPNDAKILHNLANAYRQLERLDDAARLYERALSVDPSFGLSHYMLGRVRSAEGRFDLAVAHYERALELMPDHTAARYHLERAREKLAAAP